MKRRNLNGLLLGLAAIAFFTADAWAYYHPRAGRFVQRDPVGYADAMDLYQYVGSNPIVRLDLTGLEWTVKRTKFKDRASAECDCDDTVADLAKRTNMETSDFIMWLRAEDGRGLPKKATDKIGRKGKFSVPNKVFVGVGQLNMIARAATGQTPKRIYDILDAKGFNATYKDWVAGRKWESGDIPVSRDLCGIVYFGHGASAVGKKKWNVIKVEDPIRGALSPASDASAGYYISGLANDGQFGVLILKSCFAKQGGWGKKASSNAHAAGAVWLGSGLEFAGVDGGTEAAARNAK